MNNIVLVNDWYSVNMFQNIETRTFTESSDFLVTHTISCYDKWDKVQIHISRGGSTG